MISDNFKIIGDISLPGDKSIAHRVLLLSAFIKGQHTIQNFPNNEDVFATLLILNQYGLNYYLNDDSIDIDSCNISFKDSEIDCNESGTTARLMCGYLSGLNINCIIKGSESLSKRPMSRIVNPLREFGVDIDCNNGMLPIRIKKTNKIKTQFNYRLDLPSAQIKSAIIFYALSIDAESSIEGKIQTRDHLELLLSYLKYPIKMNNKQILIKGNHKISNNLNINLPGDISSASFLIAAAILLKDSNLIIRNICVNPHRMGFVKQLIKMGAKIRLINKRQHYGELIADIKVEHSMNLVGVVVEETDVPSMIDEIPIFCVVAAFSIGRTEIKGIKELKHKESDRITAIIKNFSEMGTDIKHTNNNLLISPKKKMYNTSINSFNDHRIFMSFYIANLVLGQFYSDKLEDNCYRKSFINFIEVMQKVVCEKF